MGYNPIIHRRYAATIATRHNPTKIKRRHASNAKMPESMTKTLRLRNRLSILRLCLLSACLLLLAACDADNTEDLQDGPRLVAEATLGPATEAPAPDSSGPGLIADDALPTLADTPIQITPEVISPLSQVTVESNYVIVTPTLPPSKTPTTTPTFTPSPTQTATPTRTVTATATTFLLPTSQIIAVTLPVAAPINEVCDSTWFFIQPRPENCPLNPPSASQGVYQSFQNGHMIWVGAQDAIYVMYNDQQQPRWQVFRDYFVEGMVEETNDFGAAPAANLWQPRRGFGMLWRGNEQVRQRIGWATMEWELPYSVQVQNATNGAIFLSQVGTGAFGLLPGGNSWTDYSTASGGVPLPPAQPPVNAGAGGTAIPPLPGAEG